MDILVVLDRRLFMVWILILQISLFANGQQNGDQRPPQYKEIYSVTGNCTYMNLTAVRLVQSDDCGLSGTKRICHVVATCDQASEVQGSCFVDTLCPPDPIECLARRDIVRILHDSDAVSSAEGRSSLGGSPYTLEVRERQAQ